MPSRWSSEELSEDDLIFEAATLEDIELAYMGNEILVVSDEATFESITTTRIRLAQTMRAFVRALNRGRMVRILWQGLMKLGPMKMDVIVLVVRLSVVYVG